MKYKWFIAFCLVMVVTGIYLFATAPVPLEAKNAHVQATIPVERVFDVVNSINAKAREIYTREIVGAGKTVGLAFDENWAEEDVRAGPLPALFLRATASVLERHPIDLGLFLGSEYPINPSNLFSGEQLAQFQLLQAQREPQYGSVEIDGTRFGMYPDIASAEACVTCHNDHADTPKADWQLHDVMGATTWTYPRQAVSAEEYVGAIEALYDAIGETYDQYLAEVETFEQRPEIGEKWPRDGYFLPSREVFTAALREATAPMALVSITENVADAGQQAEPAER